MKKLNLAAAACLMATLAIAQTNEVTSVNVVGYYKITIPPSGQYTLVALNLDAIDPTNQTLQGIFGSQLPSAGSFNSAYKLLKYNTAAGGYKIYARHTTSGNYYEQSQTFGGGTSTNPTLMSGEAFWLQSRTSATTNYDITVMGEVVSVVTSSVTLVTGYQQIGFPFSTDVMINNTTLTNGRAAGSFNSADQILIFTGSGYTSLGLRSTDRKWYTSANWGVTPATNVIPMGGGVWYLAKGTNPVIWAQTNIYIGNL